MNLLVNRLKLRGLRNGLVLLAPLTYTALQEWGFVTFLVHSELWLRDQNGKQIAYAEYHLTGGGGFDFSKWASTESKMNPVIDQLLSGYGQIK